MNIRSQLIEMEGFAWSLNVAAEVYLITRAETSVSRFIFSEARQKRWCGWLTGCRRPLVCVDVCCVQDLKGQDTGGYAPLMRGDPERGRVSLTLLLLLFFAVFSRCSPWNVPEDSTLCCSAAFITAVMAHDLAALSVTLSLQSLFEVLLRFFVFLWFIRVHSETLKTLEKTLKNHEIMKERTTRILTEQHTIQKVL